MSVVFRCDASIRIGSGHVMRCLVLAEQLRLAGAVIHFVCRDLDGNLIQLIRDQKFDVTSLPKPKVAEYACDSSEAWLSVPLAQDVAETQFAVAGLKRQWLVVDHYGADESWQDEMKSSFDRMMVIDDLGRHHRCDLLLDQNYALDYEAKYRGKLTAGTIRLLGPEYALLKKAYAGRVYRVNDHVNRIFVFMGGGDVAELSLKIIKTLCEYRNLVLDIVMRSDSMAYPKVLAWAESRGGIILHSRLPHLAELMNQADIAFGAGGTTTWERLCVGVPAIVTVTAENQRSAVESLAADGLILCLGDAAEVDQDTIHATMRTLEDRGRRESMSMTGRILVDGKGAQRVQEKMIELCA